MAYIRVRFGFRGLFGEFNVEKECVVQSRSVGDVIKAARDWAGPSMKDKGVTASELDSKFYWHEAPNVVAVGRRDNHSKLHLISSK